jgi:hypothetical protein
LLEIVSMCVRELANFRKACIMASHPPSWTACNRRSAMASADYRIESNCPLINRLLPQPGPSRFTFADRAMAVAMAAKGFASPSGQEIRVVHIPSGEVVYRKAAEWGDRSNAVSDT